MRQQSKPHAFPVEYTIFYLHDFFGNEMKEMRVRNYKIENIKPYENNPRNNEEAVQYVANSIKEFGFKVPLVIDKDKVFPYENKVTENWD